MSKQSEQVKKTRAEEIWEQIKEVKVNLYGLPGKTVKDICSVVQIDPNKCFVTSTIPAALPCLEEALKDNFTFDLLDRFIVIERKEQLNAVR